MEKKKEETAVDGKETGKPCTSDSQQQRLGQTVISAMEKSPSGEAGGTTVSQRLAERSSLPLCTGLGPWGDQCSEARVRGAGEREGMARVHRPCQAGTFSQGRREAVEK